MSILLLLLSLRAASATDALYVTYNDSYGVCITEVHARPTSPLADRYAEWFEVTNLSESSVNLAGFTVEDDSGSHRLSTRRATAGSLVLGPGDAMVFGRSLDATRTGGVVPDYLLPSWMWLDSDAPDSADYLTMSTSTGEVVSEVAWDVWPTDDGFSLTLDGSYYAEAEDPDRWCAASTRFSGVNYGTPGAANDSCIVDVDGDGYEDLAWGGDDCDDTDDQIHPYVADEALTAPYAAAAVIDSSQGLRADGSEVLDARKKPEAGLTYEPLDGIANSFFSLGFADATHSASITVAFGCPVQDGAGDDLRIYEKTYEPYPAESAAVYAWNTDTATWVYVGEATNLDSPTSSNHPTDLDLAGLDLPSTGVPFVLIEDTTDLLPFASIPDADGFDLNGVYALHDCEGECDGVDNNCSGVVDGGFPDTDGDGLADCVDPEECDGLDNNGDGQVDEGYLDSDGDGIADCIDPEECDGLDNNGDGQVDEGYPDSDGDGIADCADCEECDGLDNDGDGLIDEGFSDYNGEGIADCLEDVCIECGDEDCVWIDLGEDDLDVCFGPEECDGADNDGDGLVDEDFPDTDGDGIPDCLECEECDGLDNDGDGLVDEDYSDADGDGVADCIDPEICDGDDNDGDGLVDEGYPDTDGDGVADCVDCEECDGLDNDGDGLIDEGFSDYNGDGIADCLEDVCIDCGDEDCVWTDLGEDDPGVCFGPEECDGADNDDDGLVDEDFPDTDGDGIPDCLACEECDGMDNDGDGLVDEDYPDTDGDGIADCVDPETCDGLDNDGDGLVDEGFEAGDIPGIAKCMTCEPNRCNSDPGYGDACDAADNEKKCSAVFFDLWCHRRDSWSEYKSYDNWHYAWVDARCDGAVVAMDKNTRRDFPRSLDNTKYTCTDSRGRTWGCETPLVFVLPGARLDLRPAPGRFNLGHMTAHQTSDWPSPQTPWLALDRDRDGQIDDARELFGSATILPDGSVATNGFGALAALDANGDQRISPDDPAWAELLVWADQDQDRVSAPGELSSLAAWGVTSISLKWAAAPSCDARGNCGVERAEFTFKGSDGLDVVGEVVDVHLVVYESVAVATR